MAEPTGWWNVTYRNMCSKYKLDKTGKLKLRCNQLAQLYSCAMMQVPIAVISFIADNHSSHITMAMRVNLLDHLPKCSHLNLNVFFFLFLHMSIMEWITFNCLILFLTLCLCHIPLRHSLWHNLLLKKKKKTHWSFDLASFVAYRATLMESS